MPLKELQIELTNACQAKCLMCSHRNMLRKVTHMDLSLFEKVVNEAISLSQEPYFVGICGVGEPLLHPQFTEALTIARRLPRLALGTNGQALTEEKIQSLLSIGFDDLTLSLDAISPEVHSKMRPGLSFTIVLENVLNFFKELRRIKRFWRTIYIQLILTNENQFEMYSFIDYWLTKTQGIEGVVVFIKPMYQWPGLENPLYPGPKEEIIERDRVLWGPINEKTSFRDTCNLFDNWVMIQSDGSYQPCCMNIEDDFRVGNVKDNTILELYNSEVMNKYRGLFREKKFDQIPFCRGCK
jgi:radical SAM protein with 4Fe4S-binding SPASM domain